MAKVYTVRIEVEEYDKKKERSRNLDLQFSPVAAFRQDNDAVRFATFLYELAGRLIIELSGKPLRIVETED